MLRRCNLFLILLLVVCLLGALLPPRPVAARSDPYRLQRAFSKAAREFHVPLPVLLAVAYNKSLWEHHDGRPSADGAYGVMALSDVDRVPVVDGRGQDGRVERRWVSVESVPRYHTLEAAARLLGVSPEVLKRDPAQNIRGGAALLASYEQQLIGATPSDPAKWYGAVAKFSGSDVLQAAKAFADDVYATINSGAARVLADGQVVRLRAQHVVPARSTAKRLHLRSLREGEAECPPGLACNYVPALYTQFSSDPGDYGNYDLANRPADGLEIQYIVIHDTEGSYASALSTFTSQSYVSAHYLIRSSDGLVTQLVPTKDVAWQAGNWYVNIHSIGIEHEGFAVEGATWYTEQMYRSSARLVRYLAARFHIPLDRAHILGHDDVPGPGPAYQGRMHWDPGPYWDWAHYMALLGIAPRSQRAHGVTAGRIVMIAPNFHTNKPTVTYTDSEGNMYTLPSQPANFVYLHTAPSFDAPLISDPALHPDGSAGTTLAYDWGDKAVTGQRFYLAEQRGDWSAIFYGGKKAWFYNPGGRTNTVRSSGLLVTPKPGAASVQVYGAAYPSPEDYASAGVPTIHTLQPLQYAIPAGQYYVAWGPVRAQDYYAVTFNAPEDYRVVDGHELFYVIAFNHRIAFVRASDVAVIP
ncbi:N-acetylmuramyl-L-alanine amidase, negative regulator of AmpC, AmpD [Thermobaculum terrenum ATCC BAA-798]|uniref:N-acetylmuramoyl-L-alanine amidase n=1 Tax=Thermobaculum terrenum (strain ATCC BAA-798 / CCMEE 7001 / YNP1) TaxID=525904 RepID=D1CGY2_THET1|nr:N-acetylmuramyl-L-alanine amidase, negative regulator of AmpC, AmpD [Thermobaculum terrenum ATCC BAA-798]